MANDDLDREILAGIERVVMFPTADAYEQPADLVASAVAWGERIGVEVDARMVLTRRDLDDEVVAAVAAAPAVVFAGDSAIHLRSVLKDTELFAALERRLDDGGVLIAAGESAAALCDPMTDRRGGGFGLGLGLVTGLALVTELESWPPDQVERTHALANVPVVDLPTGSALVRDDDGWRTVGAAAVHGELPAIG